MKTQTTKIPFEEACPRLFSLSIFKDFSKNKKDDVEMFRKLYDKFSAESYDAGDSIIKEGEQGRNLYILTSGCLQISRKTQFNDEIAIADLDDRQNVFFGESALVETEERSATVRATTKCKVLVLDVSDFFQFCTEYPRLGFFVYRQIIKRMQQVIKRANNDITRLYVALFKEIEGTA